MKGCFGNSEVNLLQMQTDSKTNVNSKPAIKFGIYLIAEPKLTENIGIFFRDSFRVQNSHNKAELQVT